MKEKHSSQENLMKILTTPSWLLLCTNSNILIVQKLTLVVEFWALCLPADCHCLSIAVVMSCTCMCWATTMMWPKAIACMNEHYFLSESFRYRQCSWVGHQYSLQDSCKESCKLYWWPTASCCSSWDSCEQLKQPVVSIHLLKIIDLAIHLPNEEASVFYPECILWATVH